MTIDLLVYVIELFRSKWCTTIDSLLEQIIHTDQKVRQSGYYTNMDSVDRANQTAVVSIIENCGFPTAKEVGSDGMLAMWLTIQHSSLEYMLAYEELRAQPFF